MWIGLDDTDARTGGCTTFVAFLLLSSLTTLGIDLIGYPRLVRLNPNIPWKTRGNGALAVNVGHGKGKKTIIGRNKEEVLYSYQSSTAQDTSQLLDIIQNLIESIVSTNAQLNSPNTNPGYVIMAEQPPPTIYSQAIHNVMTVNMIEEHLTSTDAIFKGYKNKRGLIGATAAISWPSTTDKTYELIAYRPSSRWGSSRIIDIKSVINFDQSYASSFNNYDYKNKHLAISPHSPCPILFGIRGENPSDLINGLPLLSTEPYNKWVIFESNQATDDHLQPMTIDQIKPYQSVIVEGIVVKQPYTIKGGHVLFTLQDQKNNAVDCAAYEPTKEFRSLIRALNCGDRIRVFGGVRQVPVTINLEKLQVLELVETYEKLENPRCPLCQKHMKSKGLGQGFICKKCKTTSEKPLQIKKQREIQLGYYEVPVCARRHLSKPLKRMDVRNTD